MENGYTKERETDWGKKRQGRETGGTWIQNRSVKMKLREYFKKMQKIKIKTLFNHFFSSAVSLCARSQGYYDTWVPAF